MSNFLDTNSPLHQVAIEGDDSFTCLINGELFSPNPVPGQKKATYGELQYYNNITGVNLYSDDYNANRAVIIFFSNPQRLQPGKEYNLHDPEFFVQFIDFNRTPANSYLSRVQGTIRIDKCELSKSSSRIIAGSFEFTATSDDGKEFAEISEGRFRITDIAE